METELAKTLNLEAGDMFTIYDEQLIINGSKNGYKSACVKLLDARNIILSENHIGGNLMIVDRGTAGLFPGALYRQVVNVWTEEGGEAIAASGLEHISDTNGYSFRNAGRFEHEQAGAIFQDIRGNRYRCGDSMRIVPGFYTLVYVS